MQGADLTWAQMQGATRAGATIRSAPARVADLRGNPDLTQEDLSSLVGDASTLLPDKPDPVSGEPFFVCTCWTADPPDFAILLGRVAHSGIDEAKVRDPGFGLFCAPGTTPQKTGTPWPLDRDPPWGAQGLEEAPWDYYVRAKDWARTQPTRGPCPPPEPAPAGTP